MDPSNDAHQKGLESLREQLATQRASRKLAQRRLKARTEEALACTPAIGTRMNSPEAPMAAAEPLRMATPAPPASMADMEVEDSGIGQLPPPERLDARRKQILQARNARRNGLSKLKKTTYDAMQVVRETTLMELGELKKRLSDSSEDHQALGA